jgi:hypothetical protein
MISKVKTLNPKTKGQTIKEKGNINARNGDSECWPQHPAVPTSSAMQ